jgi:hypothetical protein
MLSQFQHPQYNLRWRRFQFEAVQSGVAAPLQYLVVHKPVVLTDTHKAHRGWHPIGIKNLSFHVFFSPVHVCTHPHTCPTTINHAGLQPDKGELHALATIDLVHTSLLGGPWLSALWVGRAHSTWKWGLTNAEKCIIRLQLHTKITMGCFTLWPCHLGILRQKKNYGNSIISPCKNIIFKKSSKRNQILQDIITL